nr:MAG TPA: hypothetical protein [Caudoviricetes sp.]
MFQELYYKQVQVNPALIIYKMLGDKLNLT